MDEWLQNPLTYVLLLAAGTAVFHVGRWVGNTNTDRQNFKEFMTDVRGKLDSIFKILSSRTVGSGSPTQLTDLGHKISGEVKAKAWAKKNAAALAQEVAGKQPYEIQDFSFDYVFNRQEPNSEEMALWKESAYQHGLDSSEVKNVLMVELRDALLEIIQKPTPDISTTPEPSP